MDLDNYITGTHIRNHKKCERLTYLNFHGDPKQKLPFSDFQLHLIEKRRQYEAEVLSTLSCCKPEYAPGEFREGFRQTLAFIKEGVEYIYKPVLLHGRYLGLPDLLEKVEGPSLLGTFHYRVTEIKSGLSLKAEYTLPIAFYSYLLFLIQERWPEEGKIILGDKTEKTFPIAPHWEIVQMLLAEIEEIWRGKEPSVNIRSRCRHCGWRERCLEEAKKQKDISLIFNLPQEIRQALLAQGIETFADLAEANLNHLLYLPHEKRSLMKNLQIQAQALEQQKQIVLRRPRLPETAVEIFFDMEEDADSHINYLFGLLIRQSEQEEYKALLATEPKEESVSALWKDFITLMECFDDFTIYHFHRHERVQLERFASRYGINATLYRKIMRNMIDLYPVITSSVVLPLHSYSIKTIAKYLGFQWSNALANASQSMYWYSQWLERREDSLLDAIIQYNRDDCIATRVVKDWLTTL